jgi:hypothetical protein
MPSFCIFLNSVERFIPGRVAAPFEWQGKKYSFIGEETRQEFARRIEIPVE